MKLDGSKLIELLTLPEWDEKVQNLLKEIGEKRPKLNENEYSTFVTSKEYGLEWVFTEESITKEQKENCNEGNLYFNCITFYPTEKTILPFLIEDSDTYDEIEKKIGKEALYGNQHIPEMVTWKLIKNDKKYCFRILFSNKNLNEMLYILVAPFNEEHDNSTWAIPFIKPKK